MTKTPTPQDITIRGGIINVPHSTTPTHPPRHQPNTPRTKKHVKTRSDHQAYGGDSTPTTQDSPPPQSPTADEPTTAAAEPSAPPPDEPETDSPD